jgi:aminoglycoside phosphotransferase family enzyme
MGDGEPGPDLFDSHVVETHISYVVFVGDRVYKVKKPRQVGRGEHRSHDRP